MDKKKEFLSGVWDGLALVGVMYIILLAADMF